MLVAVALSGLGLAAPEAVARDKDLTVVDAQVPFVASIMPVGANAIRVGQPIRFKAVSTQDGWGYVYAIGASGRVTAWAEAIRLKAGTPLTLPVRGRVARAVPPGGYETVVFVASKNRLKGFLGGLSLTSPLELPVTSFGLNAALVGEIGPLPFGNAVRAGAHVRVIN